MDKDVLFLVDTATIDFTEESEELKWVHALPVGEYTHPVWGKLSMTAEKVKAYAESVKNKVRGIDLSINYMHGTNGGDGPAAGWVKDAEPRPDGLWLQVDFTEDSKKEIKDKKWRYFSAEFKDKWKDALGKVHENVFFGGALTNRPYMKNLLPINLSETAIEVALELAETIKTAKKVEEGTHKEEQDMDLKKLSELLGLPEGSNEATVETKLAELLKVTPPPAPTKAIPTVPQVNLSEELTKLAEENPLVKALMDTVDAQNKALTEHHAALRESEVTQKLAEFDRSKIVLTPRAKDLVHDLVMDMPTELHERFWELLGMMRTSSSVMVELGERAGTSVRYGRSKDAKSLFLDTAQSVAAEKKITLTEAMGQVAAENPDLYQGYRQESFSFRD